MDENERMEDVFREAFDIGRIIRSLEIEVGFKIEPENTPRYQIALHEGTSFPVGKVEFCNLYPMTFSEFLLACGEELLYEVLEQNDLDMMKIFKNKYIDYLK